MWYWLAGGFAVLVLTLAIVWTIAKERAAEARERAATQEAAAREAAAKKAIADKVAAKKAAVDRAVAERAAAKKAAAAKAAETKAAGEAVKASAENNAHSGAPSSVVDPATASRPIQNIEGKAGREAMQAFAENNAHSGAPSSAIDYATRSRDAFAEKNAHSGAPSRACDAAKVSRSRLLPRPGVSELLPLFEIRMIASVRAANNPSEKWPAEVLALLDDGKEDEARLLFLQNRASVSFLEQDRFNSGSPSTPSSSSPVQDNSRRW